MKTNFEQTYLINAPLKKVWDALTDPKIIEQWGGGPAKMDDKVGTKFSLWGGDIWGKNIEVVPHKTLAQEWYGGDWKKPSLVVFILTSENGKTKLILKHSDLPEDETENFEDGWKDYYLGPLKDMLESK